MISVTANSTRKHFFLLWIKAFRWNWMIRLYFKNPREFERNIFGDGFKFVHISFVSITKFILLWIKTMHGLLVGIGWSVFYFLNPREFCAQNFREHIQVFVYTVCKEGQILNSETIFSGSLFQLCCNHSFIYLSLFTAFSYCAFNCFISFFSLPTEVIFKRIINFCFALISLYGVILFCT